MILRESDVSFIKANLKDAESLLASKDVNLVLEAIDDLILEKGFVSHEEGYNEFGREAQRVYDRIYLSNA